MKKIFLLVGFLVLITGAILVSSIASKNSNNKEIVTGSTVKNPALVTKMESLYKLNLQRDITLDDLKDLDKLVNEDNYASKELQELKWFIENKETLHISHSITALEVYASTGKEVFCITDSASHLRAYIKHNEEDLLLDDLQELPQELKEWKESVKQTQRKDQTYFKNFEDINKKINNVLTRINGGDRSKQVSSDLYYIETYGVC